MANAQAHHFFSGHVVQRLTFKCQPTLRVYGARDGFEQRGFTRTVGPEHGHEFARHHAQADALQSHGLAVRGAESVQFKHGYPGSTGFVYRYRLR